MQYKFISFDLADQEFKFYTKIEWHNLITEVVAGLVWERGEDVDELNLHELFEAYFGDEFFWSELPV